MSRLSKLWFYFFCIYIYIYLNGYIYICMIKIELNIRNRYRDFLYTNNWLCVAACISVVTFENLS